jgi:DNA-binding MarR family transcriptional regulator
MLDDPLLDTAIAVRRAISRLSRRLRTEAREEGLSVAKHSALGNIYRDGPATPGSLALAEGVQPQSLTRVLAELEEAGYILRRQDEEDRRQFKLEITDPGRAILQREATRRAIWLASAMASCLSATEQELLRLAAQLMDRLAGARVEEA